MIIHEPTTLLTDLLLAAFGGGLAWRLRPARHAGPPARRWWSRALGLTGASAFVGGTYHGFGPNFSPDLAALWWIATLQVISLVSAAMAAGLLAEIRPARGTGLWAGLIVGKFTCFAVLAVFAQSFTFAVIDYGLTMFAWAVAAVWLRRPWRDWMLAAIGLSAAAAAVQQLHLAPSQQFNHNDLYHVIQAFALGGYYAAGRRLTDVTPAVSPRDP
ncbi:MAG TPA: hypothetical protein VG734_17810 [Lacunisphaera sp.]|nr:hypothetical protein [Lacunisphaera sp.]